MSVRASYSTVTIRRSLLEMQFTTVVKLLLHTIIGRASWRVYGNHGKIDGFALEARQIDSG